MKTRFVAIVAGSAVVMGLVGCASASDSRSGEGLVKLDKRAVHVCTVSGSTPLPRTGSERVVGAVDSSVKAATKVVDSNYRDQFDQLVAGVDPGTYLALCYEQIEPKGVPANGRVIIVQFDDAAGSTFVGTW